MQLSEIKVVQSTEVRTINWNGTVISIKQYLPVNDKLALISWVINQSADDMKFYNVGKIDVFFTLGILQYYTDIEFNAEDKPTELYDIFVSSGLYKACKNEMAYSEYEWLQKTLNDTVDSIYKYQNSVMGILDTVTADYENLNFDVEKLQQNISNPENLALLKDVVTKLG